jgi:hypothetical protein
MDDRTTIGHVRCDRSLCAQTWFTVTPWPESQCGRACLSRHGDQGRGPFATVRNSQGIRRAHSGRRIATLSSGDQSRARRCSGICKREGRVRGRKQPKMHPANSVANPPAFQSGRLDNQVSPSAEVVGYLVPPTTAGQRLCTHCRQFDAPTIPRRKTGCSTGQSIAGPSESLEPNCGLVGPVGWLC